MRTPSRRAAVGLAALALAAWSPMARGDLIYTTFDPPGAAKTYASAINGAGTVAGEYLRPSEFNFHGYIRDASGAITEFDPAGSVDTHAVGINDSGTVVGHYSTGGSTSLGFIRDSAGNVTSYDLGNGHATNFAAINRLGVIAGDALVDGIRTGLVRDAAGGVTFFSPVANSTETLSTAVNSLATVLGEYTTGPVGSAVHAFLRGSDGTVIVFDAPGSSSTYAVALNNLGQAAGNFTDSTGAQRGFIRDASGNFTVINNPFAAQNPAGYNNVYINAINDAGAVAGQLFDQFQYVGFIRDASGNFTLFEPGGSANISVLSNTGYAAGNYADPANSALFHGAFFNTVPEPSALALVAIGAAVAIGHGLRRRRDRR